MKQRDTHQYFVTGIGTDVGKTLTSAILVQALKADYWKPIQAGDLDYTDTDRVRSLVANSQTFFHPEVYKMHTPASPHYAAQIDDVFIDIDKVKLPYTKNHIIVEGAGGTMVPLNENHLIIDLIASLNIQVILVSRHYLGSIHHTLATVESLKSRGIPIKGIVFNGDSLPSTENIILSYTGLNKLFRIPHFDGYIDIKWITQIASEIKQFEIF